MPDTIRTPGLENLKGYLQGQDKLGAYALGATLLLGLALRLYRLGEPSMWTDEIMGGRVAAKSVIDIVTSPDSTPDLFYVISHFFLYLGNNDFILRLPAAIFGVLSIFAIYKMGKLLFGREAGLMAALLMAVSVYHVMYSQEARAYTALAFFTTASFYWFWKASESGKRRHWLWYVLATVLNMYTHAFAIFVLGLQGLTMGLFLLSDLRSSSTRAWKRTIRKALPPTISALAILVLSVFSYKGIIAAYQFGSQASFGGNRLEFNLDYYLNLLARYGAGNEIFPFLTFLALFLVGVWSAFSHNWKAGTLLLAWLAGPFIILSFYKTGHFFHIRYAIFTYVPFALLVALGLTTSLGWLKARLAATGKLPLGRSPRLFLATGALAIVGLNAGPLSLYYQMDARLTDYKGIAEYLKANYQPGTTILVEGSYDRQLIGHYLNDEARRIPLDTANGDIEEFEKRLLSGREVWYISNVPVFDSVVLKYFKQRKVFAPASYLKLGQRGLIDWDNSWFGEDLIWRYYPTLYYGLDRDYLLWRQEEASRETRAKKDQLKAALKRNLLYNGGFELDGEGSGHPLGWKAKPEDMATQTESGVAFGKRSVLLQPNTLGNTLYQRFTAGDSRFAGKVVTFGVWARSKNPSGNLTLALLNRGREDTVASPLKVYRNLTDKWRLFTLVTLVRPGYEALEIYVNPDDNAVGSSVNDIYVDGAFVLEGDYSPLTLGLEYNAFQGEEAEVWGGGIAAAASSRSEVTAVEGTSETGYVLPEKLQRGLEDMSLLANGSFEVDGDDFPLGWVGTPGLTSPYEGDAPSGAKSLLLQPQTLGNALYQRFVGPSQAHADKALTLGVWARTATGLGNLKLTILNDGTTENMTNYQKVFYGVDASWRFYTLTTTVGPSYRSLQAYIFPDDGSRGDSFNRLFVDGAVLVEGGFDEALAMAQQGIVRRPAAAPLATPGKPPAPAPTPTPSPPVGAGSEESGYSLSLPARQALAQASLLANGSFEDDVNGDGLPDRWLATPPDLASYSTAAALSGSRAVALRPRALSNALYQNLELGNKSLANKKITLGVWARTDSPPAALKLQLLNNGTTEGLASWNKVIRQVSGEWRLFFFVTTVPEKYQRLEAYFYPDDGASGDSFNPIMLDGAFLVEGDLRELLLKPEAEFRASLAGPQAAPRPTPGEGSATPSSSAQEPKLTLPEGSYILSAAALGRLTPRNLVRNGSFELDAEGDKLPDGWSFLFLGTGYLWEGDTPASPRSLLLQPKAPGSAVFQTVERKERGAGKISLIVKAKGSASASKMRLALLGGEKSANTVLAIQGYAKVAGNWDYYGLTAQAPAGYQALAVYVYPDDGAVFNNLFIDEVMLVEEDVKATLTAAPQP